MHYARRGLVTPEMEYVAIRENIGRDTAYQADFATREEAAPTRAREIAVNAPLIPQLRDLKPEELDIMQIAHNYGVFETVLNKSLATDLETAEIVLKLIKGSYLRIE